MNCEIGRAGESHAARDQRPQRARSQRTKPCAASSAAARAWWSSPSLAIREFALGVEALERFVRGEPLRRVHESVFAVLALESEPVDPRL